MCTKIYFHENEITLFYALISAYAAKLASVFSVDLIGSATSAGWTVGDAIEMTETSPGSISTSGQVN